MFSESCIKDVNKKLITRANELYYDNKGGDYEDDHDEIFLLESARWKKISNLIFNSWAKKSNRVIVDFGCGTGFVPLSIMSDLNRDDYIYCIDVSSKMLSECEKNLKKAGVCFKRSFLKIDGSNCSIKDEIADVVTVNSVLHHVSDPAMFLKEISRITKKGGYFIIGHESNEAFQNNKILWTIYRIFYYIYNPAAFLDPIKRRGWIKNISKKIKNEDLTTSKVNKALLSEGLIEKPFSEHQLNMLVEINSVKGFFIEDIKKMLPLFKLKYVESYNHLWWIYIKHSRNPFISGINLLLKIVYPNHGKTLTLIFEKIKL